MAYGFNDDKSKYDIPDGLSMTQIIDALYPVGTIYMSVNNQNPANIFGGTWDAWGSGRVPVGVNASDTNFNTVEKTGGAATHTHTNPTTGSTTLTVNQIPAHKHQETGTAIRSSTKAATSTSTLVYAVDQGLATVNTGNTGGGQGHTHTMGNTGSTTTLQPYITCYMWKRTA